MLKLVRTGLLVLVSVFVLALLLYNVMVILVIHHAVR